VKFLRYKGSTEIEDNKNQKKDPMRKNKEQGEKECITKPWCELDTVFVLFRILFRNIILINLEIDKLY
jgi:hypothetical protein